jgi:hypothetical protein
MGYAGLRDAHFFYRPTLSLSSAISPLDLPVEELVTWRHLIGDRRLCDALAECGEGDGTRCRWWRKTLCRLFPKL